MPLQAGPMASGDFAVTKTDSEWKSLLPNDAYRVLRKKATEPAGAGALQPVPIFPWRAKALQYCLPLDRLAAACDQASTTPSSRRRATSRAAPARSRCTTPTPSLTTAAGSCAAHRRLPNRQRAQVLSSLWLPLRHSVYFLSVSRCGY